MAYARKYSYKYKKLLGFLKLFLTTNPFPKSFTQHIQFNMAFQRKTIMRVFSDKLASREFLSDMGLNKYLPKLYSSSSIFSENFFNDIPRNCVLKMNNGSGNIIVISENFPRKYLSLDFFKVDWDRYSINPDDLDFDILSQVFKRWQKLDYSFREPYPFEWTYSKIEPKIFSEELVYSSDKSIPVDYKFFMIHGQLRMVQVDLDRFKNQKRNLYDSNFVKLPLKLKYPNSDEELACPPFFDEMVSVAMKISTDIKFVRVDFLVTDKRFFLGELTNFPGAGTEKFEPKDYDYYLGSFF